MKNPPVLARVTSIRVFSVIAKVFAYMTVVVLAMLSVPLFAQTSSVTLAWDASPDADVVGYRLHYGTSSGSYTNELDAGSATTIKVDNLSAGTTYFVVTA